MMKKGSVLRKAEVLSSNPFNDKMMSHTVNWLSFKELQIGFNGDRRDCGQNRTGTPSSLGQTEDELVKYYQEVGQVRVFPTQTRKRRVTWK